MVQYLDREYEILYRECALDVQKILHENQCLMESCDEIVLMLEAEEEEDSKKKEEVKSGVANRLKDGLMKIIDKIKELFAGIKNGIYSVSSKQMTVDDYLRSETVEIRFQHDVQAIMRDLDEQYAQANSLVTKISNKTALDPVLVDKFLGKVNRGVTEYGPAVAKTAVAIGFSNKLRKTVQKQEGLTGKAERAVKNMDTQDPLQVKLAGKVLDGILRMANTGIAAYSMVNQTKATFTNKIKSKEMEGILHD